MKATKAGESDQTCSHETKLTEPSTAEGIWQSVHIQATVVCVLCLCHVTQMNQRLQHVMAANC